MEVDSQQQQENPTFSSRKWTEIIGESRNFTVQPQQKQQGNSKNLVKRTTVNGEVYTYTTLSKVLKKTEKLLPDEPKLMNMVIEKLYNDPQSINALKTAAGNYNISKRLFAYNMPEVFSEKTYGLYENNLLEIL